MAGKGLELDQEMTLTIGEPTCLDVVPFFYPLKTKFSQPCFRFVSGTPVELNALLEKGELDAALTSSLFYAARPADFLLLRELGISTKGQVRSALFFSDMLLDDLDEMTISLSAASLSASAVMQIVLNKYLQYSVNYKTGWVEADGYLLIGDSALRERQLGRYAYVYDVGELWRHYTGHAMVFAAWLIRRSVAERKTDLVKLLQRSLGHALNSAQENPELLLIEVSKRIPWLPRQKLLDHWAKIRYRLSNEDLEGLNQFFKDAQDIELIEQAPALEFLDD